MIDSKRVLANYRGDNNCGKTTLGCQSKDIELVLETNGKLCGRTYSLQNFFFRTLVPEQS